MNQLLIHESEKISVWCYPKSGIIHHEVHGYCYETPYRAALGAGSAALSKFHATAWLSDDRKGGALSRSDEEWCRTVWAPRLLDAGWRHWAVVRPQSAVGRLNVARLLGVYRALGVRAEMFSEPEAARRWLEERRGEVPQPTAPHVEVPPQLTRGRMSHRLDEARPHSPLETMVRMTDALCVTGERPARHPGRDAVWRSTYRR